jgi:hypothetical protein
MPLKRQNRKERRENRQERRDNLLPLGLGVAGTGLALYACLEAFRNKERIDENAERSQENAINLAAAQATADAATPEKRQIITLSARPLYANYDDTNGYSHGIITAQDTTGDGSAATNVVTKHTDAPATIVWHGNEMVVAGPTNNPIPTDQFFEKGSLYFRPNDAGVSQDSCQLKQLYYNNTGNVTATENITWTLENPKGIFVGYETVAINYSQTTITINGVESKRRELTFAGTGKDSFTMYYNVLDNNNEGKFFGFDQQ